MARIAYVNGRYVRLSEAAVNVEDRGLQFADSVYDVVPVAGGRLIDEDPHLDRLERSLGELQMAPAMARPALRRVMREVVRRNRIRDGVLYMQITRGTARRDPIFPPHSETTVIMTARRAPPLDPTAIGDGVSIMTVPDIRWRRRDIKTVQLLPNVLAKNQASTAGFHDAWMVDDQGFVTEGSASNAWIVTNDKQLVTRARTADILWGVTRRRAVALAESLGIDFVERPFSVAEAKAAAEAFLTSASSYVMPVTRIDDAVIGDGKAGPITMALVARYHAFMTGAALDAVPPAPDLKHQDRP